jgi:hypothetical protein
VRAAVAAALVSIGAAGCSAQTQPMIPSAQSTPLAVDARSHVIVLEYEAWFGPNAVTFQQAEAQPVLQSPDMRPFGGGYDSTDPHVITQHVAWMDAMGVDAASIDLTNNVGCIFSTGPVSPKFCNPASEPFRSSNRTIRDNTGNLYPAWSKLGTRLKLLPLLGCQTSLDLEKGADGKSGFEKEVDYFGRLIAHYPGLSVLYLGHPLMLVYTGTPVNPAILSRAKTVLHGAGLDSRYTFRFMGGFLDSQPAFWSNPNERPDGPIEIAPRFRFWSYVDRYKPSFRLYPTYSVTPAGTQPENLTVSIATPGQRGWGCPRPKLCAEDALRYGTSGRRYATFESVMKLAFQLQPTFLIVHQFNEFVRPDEGWDAQTSNDAEPTQLPNGWGDNGIDAIRQEISAYRRIVGSD